ncbi:MAG TPA: hypothetical protein V6D19_06870 [Stenomitos sp.]
MNITDILGSSKKTQETSVMLSQLEITELEEGRKNASRSMEEAFGVTVTPKKHNTADLIYLEKYRSEARGGMVVSAKYETTKLLIYAFSALLSGSPEKQKFGEYWIQILGYDGKVTVIEESLIYALLSFGLRNNVVDGVFSLCPKKALEFCGFKTKKPANRAKVQCAARNLESLGDARVKVWMPTGEIQWFGFIRKLHYVGEAEIKVSIDSNLLELFAENPAFPIDIERRQKLELKDSRRILDFLQTFSAFRDGKALRISKHELVEKGFCPAVNKKKSAYWNSIAHDFGTVGISVEDLASPVLVFHKF